MTHVSWRTVALAAISVAALVAGMSPASATPAAPSTTPDIRIEGTVGGPAGAPRFLEGIVRGDIDGMEFRARNSDTDTGPGFLVTLTGDNPKRFKIALTDIAPAGPTWHGIHNYELTLSSSGVPDVTVAGSFLNETLDLVPQRISGPDRYATATAIAGVWDSYFDAKVAFVATGENFPDALSAAAAASYLGAPLLLTKRDALPAAVKSQLDALSPDVIYVTGSTDAVSASVVNSLKTVAGSPSVIRLAGSDRYATAREIIKRAFGVDGDGDGDESIGLRQVVIATGRNFPDALSAAAGVSKATGAVVLVDGQKKSVPDATMRLLRDLDPDAIIIVGSPAAVSSAIEAQLAAQLPSAILRLGGSDRYETSRAINAFYFPGGGYGRSSTAFFAVGTNFPDALAGATLAGAFGAPLFVTRKDCVLPEVRTMVRDNILAWEPSKAVLLGSSVVIKDSVRTLTAC